MVTKNICDWDITEEKGFPSSNEGFCDLALVSCCELLLPSVNLSEFELQSFEYSQCDRNNRQGLPIFLIVSVAFSLLSLQWSSGTGTAGGTGAMSKRERAAMLTGLPAFFAR